MPDDLHVLPVCPCFNSNGPSFRDCRAIDVERAHSLLPYERGNDDSAGISCVTLHAPQMRK